MMNQLVKIDKVDITTAVPLEIIKEQVLDAGKRNLSPINTLSDWREGRAIAVVGGGPSLKDNLELLKTYKDILVCGSAHDYLLSTGIIPRYCIICDPDAIMARYLEKHHEDVTYLIGSQCHGAVFDLLQSRKCYIWDALGGEIFPTYNSTKNGINGGCTIGTRGIVCAMQMGFRNIHLFGFDSCLTNQYKHHAYDFVDPDIETLGNITEIRVGDDPNSPMFRVAGYMLAQFFDFQNLLKMYAHRVNLEVFGGGLLAYTLEEGKKQAKIAIDSIKQQEELKNATRN